MRHLTLSMLMVVLAACAEGSLDGSSGAAGGAGGMDEADVMVSAVDMGAEGGDVGVEGDMMLDEADADIDIMVFDMMPGPDDMALDPPDAEPLPDMTPPPPEPDMEVPPPPARDCRYVSTTFGDPRIEFDVGPNSNERLVFRVPGVPAPAFVDEAVLIFDSYDADHPGEEGRIFINDRGPYDLPADEAWDNQPGTGQVDVTADVIAGENVITFAPGPLDRSFFGISNVQLAVRAQVDECQEEPPPPPPPPPEAVVREIRYPQAEYTNRRTWVVGCENNAARAYAFSARGDEHEPTDCEGLYRAGGNRRGDAIFAFNDVVEAEYDIVIRSRHTENRSETGALFLVNGESRRISQRSDRGFTNDTWGRRRLSGRVEVILRAEGNSDSVIFVRLVPVGG
ncbi:MAG: hypothetical protein ACE366_09195 [Bradymonadia bacterium]